MIDSLLNQFLPTLLTALSGGFAGWLFGRRMNTANAVSVEMKNTILALEKWKSLAEKFEKEVERLEQKMRVLETTINQVKIENTKLHAQNKKHKIWCDGCPNSPVFDGD